jgi:hypothetical protein
MPAMMGLVIEQMQQYVLQHLLLRRARHGLVRHGGDEVFLAVVTDNAHETRIFRHPRAGELAAVFEQDGVETPRVLAFASQAFQPDTVGEQQMIQGAMQAPEEHAGGTAIMLLGHFKRGRIDAPVGPVIVVGEQPEIFDAHGSYP